MNNEKQLIDLGIALEKIQQLKQQLEEKDEEIKQLKKEGMAVLSKLKEAVEVIEKLTTPTFYNGTCDTRDSDITRQFLAKYRGENG